MSAGGFWYRNLCPALGLAVALHAGSALPAAAQSFFTKAKCGVFYDKWDVAGAPASTLATVGMAHESFAARDCLAKQDTATACEHYRKVLSAIDRMDGAGSQELKPEIETQMSDIGCEP